ncbi:MAG: diacylglycerol kinase family protein [Pricia sp.]
MKDEIHKVLLVVNPVAGDKDKSPIIEKVCQYLRPDMELEILHTTGTDDVENIEKRVQEFGPDRILVLGGDGTIKMVAEALQDVTDCSIGILRGGSANGLATDLDLPEENDRALITAMGRKTVKLDALRIGDAIGLHISDMGINAELIENYDKSKVRGHFGYFLNSFPTLSNTEIPYSFTLQTNGKTWETDAIMVAFANSKKFGTGALVNPNGAIDDGKFELLIFKKLDPLAIFKTLRGDIEMDDDFIEVVQTTEATISTEKPVSFQVDGEPMGKIKEVSAKILPAYAEIVIGI